MLPLPPLLLSPLPSLPLSLPLSPSPHIFFSHSQPFLSISLPTPVMMGRLESAPCSQNIQLHSTAPKWGRPSGRYEMVQALSGPSPSFLARMGGGLGTGLVQTTLYQEGATQSAEQLMFVQTSLVPAEKRNPFILPIAHRISAPPSLTTLTILTSSSTSNTYN